VIFFVVGYVLSSW